MVEFDPLVWGILVGLVGIALWIVTNWHLVRTGRGIKSEIDEKRASTEAFVRAELETLREDLGGAVEIDANPLMTAFEERIVPAIEARVENIKSVLLGKLGYAAKGVKALGEGVAEIVGEGAIEEAGFGSEWEMRLAQLGMDDEWAKKNKTAAFGLSILRDFTGAGKASRVAGLLPGAGKERRRGSPPKGFG